MTAASDARRTALVTGVNNPEGIGAAVARACAREGMALLLTGRPVSTRREHDGLPPGDVRYAALQTVPVAEVGEEIGQGGSPLRTRAADLADPEVVPALFNEAESELGPISVLVHSTAHCSADSFAGRKDGAEPVSPESHDRHFAVNSRAAALLMAEFARRFRAHGLETGRILNVSTDATRGHVGQVSYAASKNALESYSRAAAHELGPHGITVNVVAPGPVQTGWIDPGLEEELIGQLPLRRLGRPEDIADVCVFLASRRADWITGQVIYVNGGNVML